MRVSRRIHAVAGVLAVAAGLLTACGSDGGGSSQAVVMVPQDAKTLQEAADRVAENGLILISPGTYRESMQVSKPGVTVRGTDRNTVIIDGEGKRANGIIMSGAGVTVENLTVQDHVVNGVLMTGMVDSSGNGIGRGSDGYQKLDPAKFPPLSGFAVRNVTSMGNALYGIYAFNRVDGTITDNYVSGSADSGIYVGQCENCNIAVTGNMSERNAIGLMVTNASGVTVAENRLAHNRVGASLTSNHQEAYMPARNIAFVGNAVIDNVEPDSPATAEGGFGIGIGLSGTVDATVERNYISGHTGAGLAITSSRDISASGNTSDGNVYDENAVDVYAFDSPQTTLSANCLDVAGLRTSPSPLPTWLTCDGTPSGDRLPGFQGAPAPKGVIFLDVRKPELTLPSLSYADAKKDFGPVKGADPFDAAKVPVASVDLLRDLER